MCSAYLTIISPWKKVYGSPSQTFIPFTKRCSVSSMVEIWLGVIEEAVLKAVYEFSLLCYHMNEQIDRQQVDRQADRHKDAKQLIRKAKLKTSFKPNQNAQFIQNIILFWDLHQRWYQFKPIWISRLTGWDISVSARQPRYLGARQL